MTLADSRGMTPLHFAGQQHPVDVQRLLLGAGAPVDATDEHGNTPLFKAVFASQGRGNLIALLLDAGADPNVVNRHGTSPRQLAAHIGNYDVTQYFGEIAE